MRAISGSFKLSVSTVANGLKYPISYGFIRIVSPIPLPIARVLLKPFLLAQTLLGPVIFITFHFVSLPSRLSGTLAAWLGTVVLAPVARNKKIAAVDTGDLLHIVAPINVMNENNYMDALFLFGFK
jgi:hypothetical protein